MSTAFECDADGELLRGEASSGGATATFSVKVSLPERYLNPEWKGERLTQFRVSVEMLSPWDYCERHWQILVVEALQAAAQEAQKEVMAEGEA